MLADIESFLTDLGDYLEQDPLNVAAIHCKGKIQDRSLMMVCCWLLKEKMCYSTTHAIQHCATSCNYVDPPFNPSQIRYVRNPYNLIANIYR